MAERDQATSTLLVEIARYGAMALSVAIGAILLVLIVAVGSCSAVAGSCPADPPPLFDDDVVRMAFGSGLLVFAVPWFLYKPSIERLWKAVLIGVPVAFGIALVARSVAHG